MKKKSFDNPNKTKHGRHLFRLIANLIAVLFILGFALAIASLVLIKYLDAPTGRVDPEGVLFTIQSGESGTVTARRLAERDIIRSELLFKFFIRISRLDSSIKSGTYRIDSELSTNAVLRLFIDGRQVLKRLVIPEGRTLRQVANLVEQAGISGSEAFLSAARNPELLASFAIPGDSAEGYLFPDTYYFVENSAPDDVVAFMIRQLFSRLQDLAPEAALLDSSELHDRIILASIVEREYRIPEEAALMAGVFYNRLNRGIGLQSCATVVYVITEELGKPHPARLFNRDLELFSPFNTYRWAGLPPAPICSPGSVALKAVFQPEPSRYLYFRLIDGTSGKHYFSETFDEHIDAASLAVKP
ncbi:MAG: endolytic transglycosylase MltG [Spirochaetes bacterium]|nr:endolytic transglycosylase MltG [Spirochaetota bacterium]